MRTAALYDVHGNLPALEAVLNELRQEHVDRIVVGGDIVPGPMVRDTLTALRNFGAPVAFHSRKLRGRGPRGADGYTCATVVHTVPEDAKQVVRWQAQQLRA